MEKLLKYIWLAVGILFTLAIFCLISINDHRLHVYVLDVGQGDAILIRTPGGEHVLIDGGPNDKVLQQLSKVMPFYERTIEVLIISHPHADHINGLVEVVKRYQVKQILMTGVQYNNPGYQALLEQIAAQHIPLIFAGAPNDYKLGPVVFDMLYPFVSIQGAIFENVNNSSITFRLLYGKNSFYFSGDLEMEKEAELIQSHLDLHADFLKAGHHGSKTSNTEPLLDRINAKYVAISCGIDNPFGHPFYKTMQHFKERGMKIFRTDLDGLLEVISDGNTFTVKAWGKDAQEFKVNNESK